MTYSSRNVKMLLAVLLATVAVAQGCSSGKQYFTHNSVQRMSDDFKGYWENEKPRARNLQGQVNEYVADEREKCKNFHYEFPPALQNQKNDWRNFCSTVREFVANQ